MDSKRPAVTFSKNDKSDIKSSEILVVKNGFGFIKYPPNNLFFHFTSVIDNDFNDLKIGDKVQFTLAKNEDGEDIAKNVKLVV